jgi:hypothetical protein
MKTYELSLDHSRPRHYIELTSHLHAPAALSPGKELSVPIGQRLSGPWSQSGPYGAQKNLLPVPGIELRPSSP